MRKNLFPQGGFNTTPEESAAWQAYWKALDEKEKSNNMKTKEEITKKIMDLNKGKDEIDVDGFDGTDPQYEEGYFTGAIDLLNWVLQEKKDLR